MTSYPDTVFRTTSWTSSPAFSPFPYIGENFATFFINYSTSSKGPPTSPEEDISLTTSAQSSVESPTPKGSYLDSQTAFLEPFHKSHVSRLFTFSQIFVIIDEGNYYNPRQPRRPISDTGIALKHLISPVNVM